MPRMHTDAPRRLRLSFSTLACPNWALAEIIEKGAEYGYDGVEIRIIEGETDLLARPEFAPEALEENLERFQEADLEICGLASSVRFDHLDAAAREKEVAIGKLYVDLARRLGARFVRVFGDVIPPESGPGQRHEVLRNVAGGLDALGEYSEEHDAGVDVLLETHGDFADSRLMQELFLHVRSPRVGVLWDTHHPWRFYDEPVAETFERLKPWIRHTHWKDSRIQTARELSAEAAAAAERARSLMTGHRGADYVLFGSGEFPAGQTLRLLISGGYTGWISLEWEKAWHPDLAEPETALPQFPPALRRLLT